MTTRRGLGTATALVFATSLMGGCAWISTQGAISAERSLAAAGFQMKMATTAAQFTALEGLKQRQLFPKDRNGEVRWVYADAGYCKCIYVGSEKAYQRYERFAFKQRIANQQQQAAMAAQEASLNWASWGPWYSPWY